MVCVKELKRALDKDASLGALVSEGSLELSAVKEASPGKIAMSVGYR